MLRFGESAPVSSSKRAAWRVSARAADHGGFGCRLQPWREWRASEPLTDRSLRRSHDGAQPSPRRAPGRCDLARPMHEPASMGTTAIGLGLVVSACTSRTPGAQPHDMSTAQHEAIARAEGVEAETHAGRYDPNASTRAELRRRPCRPGRLLEHPKESHARAPRARRDPSPPRRRTSRGFAGVARRRSECMRRDPRRGSGCEPFLASTGYRIRRAALLAVVGRKEIRPDASKARQLRSAPCQG